MLFKKAKKSSVLQLAGMLVIAAFAMSFLACTDLLGENQEIIPVEPIDPKEEDYLVLADKIVVSEDLVLFYDTNQKEITVEPKVGGSPGETTVKIIYTDENGIETPYEPGQRFVSDIGSYKVTFDVAEVPGLFNAATDLEASGNVIISDGNPTAALFDYEGFNQVFGSVAGVKITAKQGGPTGDITVEYRTPLNGGYFGSSVVPTEVGEYDVFFEVAAQSPYAGAYIKAPIKFVVSANDPAGDDFEPENFKQTYGDNAVAGINAKPGKSQGDIIITYIGQNGDTWTSPDQPVNAGTYQVTFTVAAWGGFNEVTLAGPDFVIEKAAPSASNYNFDGFTGQTYTGSPLAVQIKPKSAEFGAVTGIYYSGFETKPYLASQNTVTFNVAEAPNYKEATDLDAPAFVIGRATPVMANFYSTPELPATYMDDDIPEVPVAVKANKADIVGAITVFYNGDPRPVNAGEYTVSFTVGQTQNYFGFEGTFEEKLTIQQTRVPNSDASLASLKLGSYTATLPANPSSTIILGNATSDFTTLSLPQAQITAFQTSLTIMATPNDAANGARIIGYAVRNSSDGLSDTDETGWTKYNREGITDGLTVTNFVNNTTRIFVWVLAEDGVTNGFYRLNTITTRNVSTDASLESLTINGIVAKTIPSGTPSTSIPGGGGPFIVIEMPKADLDAIIAGTKSLDIVAKAKDGGARIAGYAITGNSADLSTSGSGWTTADIEDGFTWTGAFRNAATDSATGTNQYDRIFVWVQAENGTTNGFYRIQRIAETN